LKHSQKGFSPLYIVIALVAVLVVGGGYYAVRHKNELSDSTNNALARTVDETVANGTPENAIKAVAEQVATEISAENTAMRLEEEATELEGSYIDNLEGTANEANL